MIICEYCRKYVKKPRGKDTVVEQNTIYCFENIVKMPPQIKEYMEKTILFAKENGYVQTIMGRRRYLRDINSGNNVVRGYSERNAINAPIQGSSADMIKIAMINIHEELTRLDLRTKMLLQVHDELVFDAYIEELDTVMPIVEDRMKNAIPMSVPIVIDMNTGSNWLEAH